MPLLLLAALAAAGPPAGEPFCAPYVSSPLYRPRARQLRATPRDWIAVIQSARDGDEVLLADGVYRLDRYAVEIGRSLTVRGASGDREAVRIEGQGFAVGGEGFMIRARDVTIADLSIGAIRNHAVSIKGEDGAQAPHLYNLDLRDIGTQHVKATPGEGVRGGVVACSRIGFGPGAVRGDYLNAIDVHRGIDWVVRDNEIYNVWGDGSGCEVDGDCGRYLAGGGPAILFWNRSSGTVVERNRIVESFLGIALGYGTPHVGGAVRNNFVYRSQASRPGARGPIAGDAGIHVRGGIGTAVDHNTVIQAGAYPGAIEIWEGQGVQVRNNLVSRPVWDRGGNQALTLLGNKTDATPGDLLRATEPHLAPSSGAVDFADTVAPTSAPEDIDGDPRPQGARRDAGCDEWRPGQAGARQAGPARRQVARRR